jgi:phage portal protein BeeE
MPLRGDDHDAARRWCAAASAGSVGGDPGAPGLDRAKGGPAGWTGTSWSAGPSFVDWSRTRRAPSPPELVESFKQVVFACATLNANGVARTPLRLYATTRHGQHRPKCLTRRVKRETESRLRNIAQLERYTKGADEIDEVVEHPLLEAVNEVNPDWDHNALIRYTVFCLDVIGRAYWWMEAGRSGPAARVWPLLAQYVLPIRDPSTSLVREYHYFDQTYEPDQLVRMRQTSMRDPYALGLAPAEAAFAYVGLSDQYVSVQENLLTQGVRPSLIVSNKDPAEPMGKEERARFQRDINTQLARGGTGLAWVVDGAVDVKTLTFPPSDLAALEISENAVQRVANCFGVPLSLLKTEDVNLANAEAGHRQHAELAIDPRCVLIASALTKWTRAEGRRVERSLKARGEEVRLGWDRVFWAFDNPVKEDQERNARVHDLYVKDGVLTINDVRADLGYQSVEWGDQPWLSSSLSQPLDDADEGEPGDEPAEDEEDQPEPDPDRAEEDEAKRLRGRKSVRSVHADGFGRTLKARRRRDRRNRKKPGHASGEGSHHFDPAQHPRGDGGRWVEVPDSEHHSSGPGRHAGTGNAPGRPRSPDRIYRVGIHGKMPRPRPGLNSHHGVMSAWMETHFRRYNANKAPAVLMSVADHRETYGVFNAWRTTMGEKHGGVFRWRKVTEAEIRGLAEDMFDAARVPRRIRRQYWAEYDKMMVALRRTSRRKPKQFRRATLWGPVMKRKPEVLTEEGMKKMYGAFYKKRDTMIEDPMLRIDPENVPEEFRPLIPYAKFWGITDDVYREDLIRAAPAAVKRNLRDVVASFNLDPWLGGPAAKGPKFSDEYIAFSAMRMGADYLLD